MNVRKAKKILLVLLILLFSIRLTSCIKPDIEGLVLEADGNKIKLAENVTLTEYEKIKERSVRKLQNEHVAGERESLGLVDLTYDDADRFTKGDEVRVWIDGDIMTSYPGKTSAKKIQSKD